LPEARQIWRDDVKSVREKRDQIPEHVTRGRKAVQEKESGGAWRTRFSIEDFHSVNIG
jgi:hypothetical protein